MDVICNAPPSHPVWLVIIYGSFAGLATLYAYLNCNSFDWDEIVHTLETVATFVGIDVVRNKLKARRE